MCVRACCHVLCVCASSSSVHVRARRQVDNDVSRASVCVRGVESCTASTCHLHLCAHTGELTTTHRVPPCRCVGARCQLHQLRMRCESTTTTCRVPVCCVHGVESTMTHRMPVRVWARRRCLFLCVRALRCCLLHVHCRVDVCTHLLVCTCSVDDGLRGEAGGRRMSAGAMWVRLTV